MDKNIAEGTILKTDALITDNTGSGPFTLTITGHVVAPPEKSEQGENPPTPTPAPKVQAGPSRPDVREVDRGPDEPPITIEKVPGTGRLELLVNKGSKLLI